MTHTVTLDNRYRREQAHKLIDAAPVGAVVTVSPPKRSNDQNSLMWTLLSLISAAKPEGRQWPPETWKCAFMHSLGHQVLFAEGLNGSGPFPLGFRSSRLTRAQMSDLIEAIHEYAARHGVQLGETA